MLSKTVIAILAYTSAVIAAPQSVPSPVVTPSPTQPSVSARAELAAQDNNDRWTISFVNSFDHPISTSHVLGAYGSPPTPYPDIMAGNRGGGVLQPGQSDSITIPRGWSGRIPVVEYGGGRQITGNGESLVEGSYQDQGQWGGWKFDINVSYV
jgi:hypothetical protein